MAKRSQDSLNTGLGPRETPSNHEALERELRLGGGVLASAIDNLGAGLLLLDRDLCVLWHNAAMARISQGNATESRRCYARTFGREEPCEDCAVKRTFETGLPHNGTVTTEIPGVGTLNLKVSTSPVMDESGRVTQVMEILHDVTATQMAESELTRYKRLIDNSEDYMAIVAHNGDVLAVNRKFYEDLGYGEDDVIGRHIRTGVAEFDHTRLAALVQTALTFGIAMDVIHLLKKDGSAVPTQVSVSYDQESRVYEAVCRDISERLRMEGELRKRSEQFRIQNEKVLAAIEQKDMFFRSISHELRTPLTSIIGFADLLMEDEDDPLTSRQKAWLDKVGSNAHRLLLMVSDLLDLSKLEAHKFAVEPSQVRLGEMLRQIVDDLRSLTKDKNLELRVEVPDDLPEIVTDAHKLGHIIVNLVSNAIKFTHEGSVTVRAARSRASVCITVSDSGIGIPEDELPSIFEEFHQVAEHGTRQIGTGLGLAIAQKLTSLLGGTITVESKQGVGTTFQVKLPIVPHQTK